jgi:hypothetical protein
MLKKMLATFPNNVDEKILTIDQKSIKKVKARGSFWDLNLLSGLFLGFVGFYSSLA